MDKKGSFRPIIIVMFLSLIIAGLWDKVPSIKDFAHAILNPTAGALLNWNLNYGMIILIFIISIFMTLAQKYGTDQKTLRRLKKEQKDFQKEMNKFKHDPKKLMEAQKNLMPLTIEMMKHSMRAIVYTGIPLILFFRWFNDTFTSMGNPHFFGFFSWFWFYFIGLMIFGMILRKWWDVV